MKRRDVLEIFAEIRGEAPAVTGPSFGGRVLHDVAHRRATIYNMELGYPTAVCLGMALSLPSERIYAIEGDGSLIAGLPTLATVGRYAPANLIILVMNNMSWATTGAQPTAAGTGADIVGLAQAAGIESAVRVEDLDTFRAVLTTAAETDGPHLIDIALEPEDVRTAGKSPAYPFDIVESVVRFRRDLEDRGLVSPIWAV